MTSYIDRYIQKTVLLAILMTVCIVMGVDALFAFVRELKSVGQEDYTTASVFQYILLTLPRRFHELLPIASLLGALLGLGALASHHELTVMRAFGVSIGQISKAVLVAAFCLALINAVIGEYLVPMSERQAEITKAVAKGRGQAIFTGQGVWLKDGRDFIHINQLLPGGRMEGVTRYEFDKDYRLVSATNAKAAQFNGNEWVLSDIVQSHLSDERVTAESLPSLRWKSQINPSFLTVLLSDPEDLSLKGLSQYIDYLSDNHLDNKKYALAFWQKIMRPFSTIVMILIAIPFIFGPLREANMGGRIFVGSLFGFAFYVLNEMLGPLSVVYSVPPVMAASMPVLLFGLLGVWLIRKAV